MKHLLLASRPVEITLRIDGAAASMKNSWNMKQPLSNFAVFSLVEVTLALGVAAFCLVVLLGLLPTGLKTQQARIQQTTANAIISTIWSDLRADLILPPGLYRHLEEDSGYQLHGHWAGMHQWRILESVGRRKSIRINRAQFQPAR